MEGKGEEIIQKKYVKWSLGLDNCTPDYVVYKKSGLDKIMITAGYRAMRGSQKIITTWRCGNEEERNGFWKTEEKKCRICGMEEGRIKHIMFHTRIKIGLGEVLNERGKGEGGECR